MDKPSSKDGQYPVSPELHKNPVRPNKASEYTPKVHVVADYIM